MSAPQQPEIGRSDPNDPNRFVGTYLTERPTSPWRSRPVHWAIAAAGIGVVVCLIVWPGLVGFAAAALAGTGAAALLLGVRGLIRGPKTITAPTDQQVTAQTEPAADQAAGLRCVCDDPVEWMTHPDVSGWIHSPGSDTRCLDARPSGTSLDGSGHDPETARTNPDTPETQPVDQPGHDPDDLRTRLAAAALAVVQPKFDRLADQPGTCDASEVIDIGFFGRPHAFGPCTLHQGHAGPVHKAANGAQWWPTNQPDVALTPPADQPEEA